MGKPQVVAEKISITLDAPNHCFVSWVQWLVPFFKKNGIPFSKACQRHHAWDASLAQGHSKTSKHVAWFHSKIQILWMPLGNMLWGTWLQVAKNWSWEDPMTNAPRNPSQHIQHHPHGATQGCTFAFQFLPLLQGCPSNLVSLDLSTPHQNCSIFSSGNTSWKFSSVASCANMMWGRKRPGHDFLLFQGFGIQASYLQLHWLWYAHIFHKPAHHVTVNIPWHFSIVSCFRHTSPIQNCSMCFRIWMADNFPSAHRLRRAVARLLPLPFSRGFFFLLLPNASSSFHPLSLLHFSIVPGALFTEARLQSFAFPYPPSAQGALFPKARLQIFAFPFHKVTTVQRWPLLH